MDNTYNTVVEGEASESSEEDSSEDEHKAVIVAGEASESDEEEIDTSLYSSRKDLPPLKVTEHSVSFESIDDIGTVQPLSVKQAGRPKYDTVLNRKLWESNLSFCNNLHGIISQTYLSASKEISNCSQQVSKSHALLQDVSHHMRLMTNDLFYLQDSIDTIITCKLLPNINLPSKKPTAERVATSQHLDT